MPKRNGIMTAKALMVLGSMSSAGKSLLVTGLCRVYKRRGWNVTPFKAQNMSNNAAVCGGGEIGRAQAAQAHAAGIEPTVDMNPILLKPEGDSRSQVVVRGQVWESLSAGDYYSRRNTLWQVVTESLDTLKEKFDLVILEGAGSPAEINLRKNDIVNLAAARYAQAPCLLAGDIDRGGVFAQLLGTLWLLGVDDRQMIRGVVFNKI
jgi:adenosylcobyric acid synthase